MVLAGSGKGEEETHGDGVVDGVNGTLPDPLVGQVADGPENLKIPDFDHVGIPEGGGVRDLDHVVVGATGGAEGDCRIELHLEGCSVDNR